MCGFGNCYGSAEATPAGVGFLVVLGGALASGIVGASASPARQRHVGWVVLAAALPYAATYGTVCVSSLGGGNGDYSGLAVASFLLAALTLVVMIVLGTSLVRTSRSHRQENGQDRPDDAAAGAASRRE
jgi:cobalamin synthase